MKYIHIHTTLDVQDPAQPLGLMNTRRLFSAPHYLVTRDGDTVRVEHLAGAVVLPWSVVAWAIEDVASTETTSEERPVSKRKVSK